jgi:AhpD family alkylhydroperoxidase
LIGHGDLLFNTLPHFDVHVKVMNIEYPVVDIRNVIDNIGGGEAMKDKKNRIRKSDPAEFDADRVRLNEIVMKYAGPKIKRFYSLDHQAFLSGALNKKTKELIGLVASLVLRCDDCVKYHLRECRRNGVTGAELEEALSIGLVIGGSITIPHLRRAFDFWDQLQDTPD